MRTSPSVVCGVHFFFLLQLCSQALDLDMRPDAFDDQYIGCESKMEKAMAKVLEEERKYSQLNIMWKLASEAWDHKKQENLKLPETFKDEYGVAVVLYTMETPYPLYKQLNYNTSIAGRSRDYYMNHFHFKALHFYLTRALQELRGGCAKRFTTYRGTEQKLKVSSQLRFGHFASSTLKKATAEIFGTATFFTISTCFGVDIDHLSDFEEQEVLIPVSEKFKKVKESGKVYTLESSGQMCSYYNCAYLGGEKRKSPECNSGTFLYSGSGAFSGGLALGSVLALLY